MKSFLSFVWMFSLSCSVLAGHPADGELSMEMDHGTLAVPAGVRVPELNASLHPDNMDGYNLELTVKHFKFVPPIKHLLTGAANDGIEGHAHLYVNGKKIQRLYGELVHLPSSLFRPGVNAITVSLNDHNHATWTLAEVEIQTTLTVNIGGASLLLNSYSSSPILKGQK